MSQQTIFDIDYHPSAQVQTLLSRYHAAFETARARHGGRIFFEDDEWTAYCTALVTAYEETREQPIILRRARALELFAEAASVAITPEDLLAGSQKFCAFRYPSGVHERLSALGFATNSGHIIYDYPALLAQGVDGLLARIAARRAHGATDEETRTLTAFAHAMHAFSRFIVRHAQAATAHDAQWAEELALLAHHPPVSFRGALQLVWYAQIFFHAENPSSAISFGRLDQYLWPYLRDDLAAGRLTLHSAGDLLAAFYLRCCEGEESQNLTLGGVDAQGEDAANPLSFLLLAVMRRLRLCQPSLSVRVHPDSLGSRPSWPPELSNIFDNTERPGWPRSQEALLQAAGTLVATGIGQPGFINDAAVIPGLLRLGIPLERARDYGIVGCYEAAPCGDAYPNTVGGSVPDLAALLVEYLTTPAALTAPNFRALLEGWFTSVADAYSTALAAQCRQAWEYWRDHAPSPFSSALTRSCIERARPLEAGGADYNLFGINMLGLGTVVDSLHAINTLVFQRGEISLSALCAAMTADFPEEILRRQLLLLPGRYGTDAPATNALVTEITTRLATMVLESRMAHNVRPYPAFFRFTADVWEHPYATPDGRHLADPLSYGCGPSSTCGGSPTAILASASTVAHALCPCGNPLALSLPAADLAHVVTLVRGYFASGGFHLHFNLLAADDLRAAQADPTAHADLMIRISGLSAKFVLLPEQLQDALIERAEHGV